MEPPSTSISIADLGVPSALGAPTTTANDTIDLGAVDTSSNAHIPGTLRYTGSGHSTNRVIELATGGGGVIESNGSGALVFTAPSFVMSANSKTLTLGGTNVLDNEIESNIPDTPGSGQNLTVIKNGSGTWVLSGSNSYGGPTVLNDGILSVASNSHLGVQWGRPEFQWRHATNHRHEFQQFGAGL